MIEPYYDHAGITIYHGDCREILPQLEPVDLVLTDPPYGMGKVMVVAGSDRTTHIKNQQYADWDKAIDLSTIPWPSCGIVSFTLDWRVPEWYKIWPTGRLMAWRKTNPTPSFRQQVVNAAEWIFFCAPVNYRTHQNTQTVISGPYESSPYRKHKSQKPLWLMKELLEMFKGNIVCDPFMGSGTTLVAAKELGRKAIGIEIEEKYCEIAVRRLAQEVLPL
jgi:DNA modification methylase